MRECRCIARAGVSGRRIAGCLMHETAAKVDQAERSGRSNGVSGVKPCDNLVTIGGAKGRAWRLLGFLERLVSGVAPARRGRQGRAGRLATGYGGQEARPRGGGEGPAWGPRTYRWIKRG